MLCSIHHVWKCFSCFLFNNFSWWMRLHFRFWHHLPLFSCLASLIALSPAFSLENWSWFHKNLREFPYFHILKMGIFVVVREILRSVYILDQLMWRRSLICSFKQNHLRQHPDRINCTTQNLNFHKTVPSKIIIFPYTYNAYYHLAIRMNRKERMNCVNDKLSACADKAIHSFKEKTSKDVMHE